MMESLVQRAPVAEKERSDPHRIKSQSCTSEPIDPIGDGVPGAPVTELEYTHDASMHKRILLRRVIAKLNEEMEHGRT